MPSGAGSTRTAPDEANVRRAGTKRTVTMELIFIGTRGNTKVRTRHHRRHSALLINYRGRNIMIDCCADWLPAVQRLSPFAIVLTHAHPDHADGLARGAPCPVFATAETWQRLKHVPVTQKRIVPKCGPIRIGGLMFEGFPVEHSLRAPAVGYRISARGNSFFYVPDLVAIKARHRALLGVDLYIGDGATVTRPIVRQQRGTRIGHTPIRTQIEWCRKEGVPRAIFTHCGSVIVRGDARRVGRLVRGLGEKRGIQVGIAHDGMRLVLRPKSRRSEARGAASFWAMRRRASVNVCPHPT